MLHNVVVRLDRLRRTTKHKLCSFSIAPYLEHLDNAIPYDLTLRNVFDRHAFLVFGYHAVKASYYLRQIVQFVPNTQTAISMELSLTYKHGTLRLSSS